MNDLSFLPGRPIKITERHRQSLARQIAHLFRVPMRLMVGTVECLALEAERRVRERKRMRRNRRGRNPRA